MSSQIERFLTVYEREFATIVRNRVYGLIALGFVLSILSLTLIGSMSGYVVVVLNLLVPLEVLVPVLCAAFGYRTLLADRESGELDILRTYPLRGTVHIAGILFSRAVPVVLAIIGAFVFVGVLIPVVNEGAGGQYLLRRTTYNGVVLFVRFVILTSVAATVFLAIVIAISAAASQSQRVVVLAVFLVFGVAIGFDLVVVSGFVKTIFGFRIPSWTLALTPTSAYRGLVLESVVKPASASPTRSGSAILNVLGLIIWFVGSLFTSIRFIELDQ